MIFPAEEFARRIADTRDEMRRRGADVLILDESETLTWTIGFSPTLNRYRACILPLEGEPVMILRSLDIAPFLERSAVRRHVGVPDTAEPLDAVAQTLVDEGYASAAIGVDMAGTALTVARFRALQAALPAASWIDMDNASWRLRLVKSEREIALLRQAAGIADQTMARVIAAMAPGKTERDAAAIAAHAFVSLGADPSHVGPITAGKGSDFLHGHLHDRPLEAGEILHLELVPRINGYSARLMRPTVIGSPSGEQVRVAERLVALQDRQYAAMRPGASARDVDAILRESVLAERLRPDYDNITGYTLGLYPRDGGRTSDFTRCFLPNADWRLEASMVFHMYTSAQGLAFSDTVMVTPEGGQRLTHIDRRLFHTDT